MDGIDKRYYKININGSDHIFTNVQKSDGHYLANEVDKNGKAGKFVHRISQAEFDKAVITDTFSELEKRYAFIAVIANAEEYKNGIAHTEKLYLPTDFTTLSNIFRKIGLPPDAKQGSYIFDDLHLYSKKLHSVIKSTENIYELNYLALLISKMNDKQYSAFIDAIENNPKIKGISDLFDYAKSFYTLKAFIVNREEYESANPYTGEWLYFPTDAETVKLVLANIGLPENASPDTYFFDDYVYKSGDMETDFPKKATIDELHYLSVLLGKMDNVERNTFDAVIETKEHTANITSIINLAHNINCYNLVYDMYSWENVGAYIAEQQGLGIETIGALADFIDYAAYGKYHAENSGSHFLGDVYVKRVSAIFEIKYNGEVKDIPPEYKIERTEKQITEKEMSKNMSDYVFKAFIVNRSEYDNGNKETSGAWLYFPTNAEIIKRTFEEIGLSEHASPDTYFFDDYVCGNEDLKKCFSQYESVDALNYLAERITELEDIEMTVFQTVLETDECKNVQDVINLTYNTEYYEVIPDIHDYDDLGKYYVDKRNMVLGDAYDNFDFEGFGQKMEREECGELLNGVFLTMGNTEYRNVYDGENIPDEYRVTIPTEPQKLTVLIVPPMQEPYTKEIPTDLKALQSEVGGNIQVVYPFAEPVGLICNNEGKNAGMDLNRALYDAEGDICDIIAGTFVLAGLAGDSFSSLDEEQIKQFLERFAKPEMFMRINGKISAVEVKPSIKAKLNRLQKEQSKADKPQQPHKKPREEML